MNTNEPGKDLLWIQALRGAAALMVLFFHMTPHWDLSPTLAPFGAVSRWGFSGVDIFFVLSGFVVYRSARKSIPTQGAARFFQKRLLRIYLGYWPVLLLIALTTVFVYHAELPALKKMVFSTLLLYPNIWDNWLAPAWSLSMEIYFYIWIGIIVAVGKDKAPRIALATIAILLAWGGYWLLRDRAMVFDGQQPLRYALTGLGIEFLVGALMARLYDSRHQRLFARPAVALLAIAVAVAGYRVGMMSPYFDRVEVMRVCTFGLAGIATLTVFLHLQCRGFTPPRWLVHVGNASYSLYLLHTFLLDVGGRLRFKWGVTEPAPLLAFLLAMPVVIVLLSLVWYHLVERPIIDRVQARLSSSARRAPAPLGGTKA